MVPGLKNCEYDVRNERLGLWSLEERRNRADLIQVFKMWKGLSLPSFGSFFDLNRFDKTRGHSLKLVKHRCRTDLRRHFFSERVVNRWNSLDESIVSSDSLKIFKNRLSKLRATRMDLFMDWVRWVSIGHAESWFYESLVIAWIALWCDLTR